MSTVEEFVKMYNLFIDKTKSSDDVLCIRSSIRTEDEAELFVRNFGQKTNTSWKIHNAYYRPRKVIFRKKWLCQHSSLKYKSFKASVNCSATLAIKVKKVYHHTTRNDSFLLHHPPLPCIIRMRFKHNHSCEEDLKYLKVPDEVIDLFYGYFDNGLSVAKAKKLFEDSLDGEKILLKSHRFIPSQRQIYYIYEKWHQQRKIKGVYEDPEYLLPVNVEALINAIPHGIPPVPVKKRCTPLSSNLSTIELNKESCDLIKNNNDSVLRTSKTQFVSILKKPVYDTLPVNKPNIPKIYLFKLPVQHNTLANSSTHLSDSMHVVASSQFCTPINQSPANTAVTPRISSVISLGNVLKIPKDSLLTSDSVVNSVSPTRTNSECSNISICQKSPIDQNNGQSTCSLVAESFDVYSVNAHTSSNRLQSTEKSTFCFGSNCHKFTLNSSSQLGECRSSCKTSTKSSILMPETSVKIPQKTTSFENTVLKNSNNSLSLENMESNSSTRPNIKNSVLTSHKSVCSNSKIKTSGNSVLNDLNQSVSHIESSDCSEQRVSEKPTFCLNSNTSNSYTSLSYTINQLGKSQSAFSLNTLDNVVNQSHMNKLAKPVSSSIQNCIPSSQNKIVTGSCTLDKNSLACTSDKSESEVKHTETGNSHESSVMDITIPVCQSESQIRMKASEVSTYSPVLNSIHEVIAQYESVKIKEEPVDEDFECDDTLMDAEESAFLPVIEKVSSVNNEMSTEEESEEIAAIPVKIENNQECTMNSNTSIRMEDPISVALTAAPEDEDHSFLMSLLPELRCIPNNLKTKVKSQIKFLLSSAKQSANRNLSLQRIVEVNNIYRECRMVPSFPTLK